ncbi:SRA stem-loop-interacting RNA-binding protein, mitochondrial-like isoform X2 [Lytechinus pictus]|uniref:SRA stem-loop-interacting RNA-binding protein, mitochondrial-like isoform X2 n=1 Tax=Lytechinus pictus TaxID=7653 RepID=UPI00240D9E44|nr:SRA stem-loop-interacting RNA-binding protein, mitochondrial-like [Lytechinus pictus]
MASRKGFEVFVSKLPWTVGVQELRTYFSQFGPVRNCRIAFDDSTGFSKGFGFVSFSNTSGIQSALNKDQHILDGQKVNVQAKQSSSPAVKKLQISDVMENGH